MWQHHVINFAPISTHYARTLPPRNEIITVINKKKIHRTVSIPSSFSLVDTLGLRTPPCFPPANNSRESRDVKNSRVSNSKSLSPLLLVLLCLRIRFRFRWLPLPPPPLPNPSSSPSRGSSRRPGRSPALAPTPSTGPPFPKPPSTAASPPPPPRPRSASPPRNPRPSSTSSTTPATAVVTGPQSVAPC